MFSLANLAASVTLDVSKSYFSLRKYWDANASSTAPKIEMLMMIIAAQTEKYLAKILFCIANRRFLFTR